MNTGFNDALDGLIMVDLRTTQNRYLKRYMGADGLAKFRAFHEDGHKNKLADAV